MELTFKVWRACSEPSWEELSPSYCRSKKTAVPPEMPIHVGEKPRNLTAPDQPARAPAMLPRIAVDSEAPGNSLFSCLSCEQYPRPSRNQNKRFERLCREKPTVFSSLPLLEQLSAVSSEKLSQHEPRVGCFKTGQHSAAGANPRHRQLSLQNEKPGRG